MPRSSLPKTHLAFFATLAGSALLLAPCQAASVRGLVLGPDDKPVPNATIAWLDGNSIASAMGDMVLTHHEVHTDAEGRFAIETQDDNIFFRDSGQVAYVRIDVPGLALTAKTLEAGDNVIHLEKGVTRMGTLLDNQGQPLANIKVCLSTMVVPDGEPIYFENPDVQPQAITDAAGHFSFSDLNPAANLSFSLRDTNYYVANALFPKGTDDLPPLFAREGATISGSLRDGKGQPLVGSVSYYSAIGGPLQAKTDEQGAFTMRGVPIGQNQILPTNKDKSWVFGPQAFAPLKAGENRQLPPFVAKPGIEVHGKFVDAVTKAPIGQVGVTAANAIATSKDDGTFSTYMSGDSIYLSYTAPSQDYLDGSLDDVARGKFNITPETKTVDVGTIELKKGIRLKGKVEIEGGTLPHYLNLNWISKNNNDSRSYSGLTLHDDGTFLSPSLQAGAYDLQLPGYEIISPTNLEVKAGENPPLTLKLRSKPVSKTTSKGRVIDDKGQPIAGAIVDVSGSDMGGSGLVTDLDGTFTIEIGRLATDQPDAIFNLRSVQHPLYSFQQGSFSFDKGTLKATDIVMVARNGQLSGRVVDANGQPVAGAWLAPLENMDVAPTRTGADGTFSLTALPQTETTWMFAQGKRFGTVKVKPDATNLEWHLPEAQTRAEDATLAAQLKTQKLDFNRLSAVAPFIGWENLETAALAEDDALGPDGRGIAGKGKDAWNVFLQDQEKYVPKQLALHAPEYVKIGGDEIELATYAARLGDDKAKAWAQTVWAREGSRKMTLDINGDAITKALNIAVLGHATGDAKAEQWLELALAMRDQLNKASRFQYSNTWGHLLAFCDEKWLKEWREDNSKVEDFEFLRGVIEKLAASDAARAEQLYPQMIALSKDAEIQGLTNGKGAFQPENFDITQEISTTTGTLTHAFATTDPKKALEMMSQAARAYNDSSAYFGIARGALALHDTDTARAALQKLLTTEYVAPEDRALAGALASSFDPKWGAELLDRAQPAEGGPSQEYESIASWALYNAPIDAALSRIKLEREWYTRTKRTQAAGANQNYDPNAYAMGPLAVAMSVIDGKRAVEWLNALPTTQGIDADNFRASIYTLLLADDATRATWVVRTETQ